MIAIQTMLCRGQNVIKFTKHIHHIGGRFSQTQSLTNQFSRGFRWTPFSQTSVRSRFGRSNFNSKSGNSSKSITLDNRRLLVAAEAIAGLGGICIYGLTADQIPRDANALSALDRATVWPDYVRQRVMATYAFLAGGAAIAAGSTMGLMRSTLMRNAMGSSGLLVPIALMVTTMGAGVLCQMLPYPPPGSFGLKHIAWGLFSANIGAMMVPVCLMGGPVLTQAAAYTGGIVGALSLVAMTAKSDRFLTWGGPLAIGLGVVFVSSLGSMFLSPVSRLGHGLSAISLYGGLILFSGFLLYDTQLVIRRAERYPAPASRGRDYSIALQNLDPDRLYPFDPINNSIHILMDAVNIFVRMVVILMNGQRRK